MQVESTLVWYIQYLCGSGGSPLVCWHVTVDIELHTVFLQHNGWSIAENIELHTSQPIWTTCNESTHKRMFTI